MRRLLPVLTLILIGGAAQAQTWAAIRKQYDRFAQAYVKNDVAVMVAILSPEYTLVDEHGKAVDFKTYRAQLQSRRDMNVVSSAYIVEILSLERKGDTATLATKEVTKGIGGADHIHRYRDVWKLEKGVWRLVSTTTLGHG